MKTKRLATTVVAVFATAAITLAPTTGAVARPGNEATAPRTGVVDGGEFVPEDGIVVTTESFEIQPGGGPVGSVWGTNDPGAGLISPLASWGTSYAISTEIAYLYYSARAKAAGNVFNGQRIVGVCFWYSRGGTRLTDTLCSNAYSTGSSWIAGSEVTGGAWDTVDPNAPSTIFNISTSRINPNIY